MRRRVKPVGINLGARVFRPTRLANQEWADLVKKWGGHIPDAVARRSKLFKENEVFAKEVKQAGYTILDLGEPPGLPRSTNYEMEKRVLYGTKK
jgi:hypothetical protein